MITDEFLLEKLRPTLDNNLFDLDNFKIPKYTIKFDNTENLIIDINKFRNKQLEHRFYYPTTDNFKFALEKSEFLKNISFIEEFPIVILNRGLWESLNNTLSTKYKSCLFIDFFCPQYNLIVELDGRAYHSSKNNLNLKIEQETKDKMRDIYCNLELNANIIRLRSFGKRQPSNDIEIKNLENSIKLLQANNTKPYNPNLYYEYLLKDWKEKYKEELNLINKIDTNCKKKIEDYSVKVINVYLRKENNSKFSESLLYRTKELFSLLYGKMLEILYR